MDLSASNLIKNYGNKIAVDSVDIKVSSGETLGLLGPNGAGKTTLFYIIAGLISCDTGKVSINGKDITKDNISMRAKKGISYLPQEASVFRRLTVKENILAALEQRKDLDKESRIQELERLSEEFNITYGRGYSLLEFAESLKKLIPSVKINVIEERDEFRPLRGALSIEKAKKVLGYEPQFPLEKGLEVYVETYQKLGIF